jgi:hypothetical protein
MSDHTGGGSLHRARSSSRGLTSVRRPQAKCANWGALSLATNISAPCLGCHDEVCKRSSIGQRAQGGAAPTRKHSTALAALVLFRTVRRRYRAGHAVDCRISAPPGRRVTITGLAVQEVGHRAAGRTERGGGYRGRGHPTRPAGGPSRSRPGRHTRRRGDEAAPAHRVEPTTSGSLLGVPCLCSTLGPWLHRRCRGDSTIQRYDVGIYSLPGPASW